MHPEYTVTRLAHIVVPRPIAFESIHKDIHVQVSGQPHEFPPNVADCLLLLQPVVCTTLECDLLTFLDSVDVLTIQ
ncbi:hypothetical protein M378DRAFT_215443 [Amanita muscaria Koide BX008]|uniref:Uncharacterized protein n=1 Tax=Amanita muscaria (strain Koide BX008) TaxID=946122 RepID=A0A0C2XAG0_AMAMK|nr:hypothetical protein M378DRAFT_215443 [Amanita muscaria Koide BX008]